MADRALLITRQDLISITLINGLVDTDKYLQNILFIQDSELRNIIGDDLLLKLEDGVNNANIVDPYWTLLKDYIKYFLAYAVASDYVLINYNVGNGGTTKYNGTNNTSVGSNDDDRLSTNLYNKSEFYGRRLINYLCDNKSLFPEYVKSETTSFFNGIELSGPRDYDIRNRRNR